MLQGALGKRIGIIGGSIAGLTAGIRLRQAGYDVTILERSIRPHEGRGSGVAMPGTLVQKCIDLNLFDSNIPRLQVSNRSFSIRDLAFTHQTRQIWDQPIFLTPFNWADIYSNLLKRFPSERYLRGNNVTSVYQNNQGCYVETNDSSVYEFDRIVAADGIGSIVRKTLFPENSLQYANYIAWRGLIDEETIVNDELFNMHGPCFMFSNGHLLMYRIPAADYTTTGRLLLNWVMYECTDDRNILKDKEGNHRSISIPPGMLSHGQIQHLHSLANQVLPAQIANIICQTKEPFIQAVFDYQAPNYVVKRVCLLGDAGDTKRPHTASGLVSALEGAISLASALDPSVQDMEGSLIQWNKSQLSAAQMQSSLAKILGRALVTEPPKWESMDQESTNQWWNDLMSGKSWYATDKKSSEVSIFESKKPFTPLRDSQIDKVCNDLANMTLESKKSLELSVLKSVKP